MFFYSILILLISLIFHITNGFLSCKDQYGNPVDWWLNYRPPFKSLRSGTFKGYFYHTYSQIQNPISQTNKLSVSEEHIFSTNSMFGRTFDQIYQSPQDYQTIQYNDDLDGSNIQSYSLIKPDFISKDEENSRSNSNRLKLWVKKIATKINILKPFAKSKGGLIWNKDKAIWYLTSAKFFPSFLRKNYKDILQEDTKGQISLCITINRVDVDLILHYLMTINVQVYNGDITKIDFDRISGEHKNKPAQKIFATPGSTNFIVKINSFNELYGTTIGSKPKIRIKELIDSDIKSSHLPFHRRRRWDSIMKRYPCYAAKNKIADILKLSYTKPDGNVIEWDYFDDQSKWAVDIEHLTTRVFCFSDLNKSELIRFSGIMVCVRSDLNQKMKDLIKYRSCQRKKD